MKIKTNKKISQFSKILTLTVFIVAVYFLLNGCSRSKEETSPVAPPDKTPAEIFPICTKTTKHYDPRISGDIVVWKDERNGNWDIYGFNLSMGSDFPICTNEADQEYASISNNTIIWIDHRRHFNIYDVHSYNLATGTESRITTVRSPSGPWRAPVIDGNYVIWEDDYMFWWEKYGYNINVYEFDTNREFTICDDPSEQACPKISGDIAVWTDFRSGDGDIYGYDLSTKKEFPICTNSAYQGWSDICGSIVVWEDERNGNSDIYSYNLSTGVESPICTEPHDQVKPLVSGDTVVWEDSRHSWWEEELNYWFYGYQLSTETEFPISRYDAIFGMGLQDFNGDTIVYYDMGGEESWDIMGLILP
jgi:TolB protein